MSDKSPLFVSALELFSHATELYAGKNPKKNKFVILHLANAIELILKDCLIDQGKSIYEGGTTTLTIWKCFKELGDTGIQIPERPVIELLIDDRNTIQHRFGFPDAESTYYYLEQVTSFFKRFLNAHYNLDIAETLKPYLAKEHLGLLGLVEDEISTISKLARVSPQAAVIQAYKLIENKIIPYLLPYLSKLGGKPNPNYHRSFHFSALLADLETSGYIPSNSGEMFEALRKARNIAAHVQPGSDEGVDWKNAIEIAEKFLKGLSKAEENGYQFGDGDTFKPEDGAEVT